MSHPVPPGVIAPKFKGQGKTAGEGEALGFIGREWKRKGLKLVIQVFRRLLKKNPRLRLVVAGVDSKELKPLATGLESQLDVMGWVQNKESFYQKVNMVIHPARLEAFGMVVTEALARGI
ncbi:MAG: glycosyltransferase family 4 protein, partial [Verrucomicrobiota bacterium]|nr:glycosyltransferase family 4 protein [Verrucomicrobiota bacterium]